ncbi:MAG TPA: hypothetical protein VK009_23230 [Chloroflexota bacterium]|nr:hypothetical protein [Chloroflexota bacterium]
MAAKRQAKRRRHKHTGPSAPNLEGAIDHILDLWDSGETDAALEAASRLYEQRGRAVADLYANLLLMDEQPEAAIAILEPLADADQLSGDGWGQLGAAYSAVDRVAHARRALQRALDKGAPPALADTARELLEQLPPPEELWQDDPGPRPLPQMAEEVALLVEAAVVREVEGDFARALELAEQAVRLAPGAGLARHIHAAELFAYGRYEDALEAMADLGAAQGWRGFSARCELVCMLARLGRWDEAAAGVAGLEALAAGDSERWELAKALAYVGDHDGVYRLLSAVSEDAVDDELRITLGLAAANLGRPEEARRILEGCEVKDDIQHWLDGLPPGRYEALRGHFPYYADGLLLPPGKWVAALTAISQARDLPATAREWLATFPPLLQAFEQWLYWGDEEHPVVAADVLCASELPQARSIVERWLASGAGRPRQLEHARRLLAGEDAEPETVAWEHTIFTLEDPLDEAPEEYVDELLDATELAASGRLRDAERALSRVIRRWPDYPEGWYWRGNVRRLEGDTARCRSDLVHALDLDERCLPPRTLLIAMRVAQNQVAYAEELIGGLPEDVTATARQVGEYLRTVAGCAMLEMDVPKAREALALSEDLAAPSAQSAAAMALLGGRAQKLDA